MKKEFEFTVAPRITPNFIAAPANSDTPATISIFERAEALKRSLFHIETFYAPCSGIFTARDYARPAKMSRTQKRYAILVG